MRSQSNCLCCAFRDAGVDVGEVGAESLDGVQDRRAVRAVERFDGFGVEVCNRLFVGAGDAVFGSGVPVEGVDGFGDAHLRGCHCAEAVQVAFCFFLELVCRGFHGPVASVGEVGVSHCGSGGCGCG